MPPGTWATPEMIYTFNKSQTTLQSIHTFADTWRDYQVHGMYSDGTTSDDNSTFGAWLVMNTKDTYYCGPLYSDIIVDGIVYN